MVNHWLKKHYSKSLFLPAFIMWVDHDSFVLYQQGSWRLSLDTLQDFDTLPTNGDSVWLEVDQHWRPTYVRVWKNKPNEN